MKKNTTKVIKEANQYLVMQCIQAFEPVTLEEIAEKTLLSRPTILEIINSFKEEGIVVNGGFRESTGGRPPQLLCIKMEILRMRLELILNFRQSGSRLRMLNGKLWADGKSCFR